MKKLEKVNWMKDSHLVGFLLFCWNIYILFKHDAPCFAMEMLELELPAKKETSEFCF